MTNKKKTEREKPMTSEMIQMENAKLFEYINNQNFKNAKELNEFIKKHVIGKRIDEIVPVKKGRKSDIEKSDDLIYQAYDSDLFNGKKLAKEALKLSPGNIRALNYLAEKEETPEAASELYKKAVDIGAKQLGENFFKKNKGYFWGMHETRPYMTAMLGLANCLNALGKTEGAIKIYQDMLVLNPNDNQGIRFILSSLLLYIGRYDEYYALYKKNKEDISTFWLYNYALYLFITEGPSQKANKALHEAYKNNQNVIAFMTGKKKIKNKLPGYYSLGGEDEATYYLMDNFKIWNEHPETMEWIFSFVEYLKLLN